MQISEGHLGTVTFVAFSFNGRLLASAAEDGNDNIIKIWDAITGNLRLFLKEHSNLICLIAFLSHDELFVSAFDDKTIKISNTATGKLH